jgi:hypothetical protein
MSGFLIEGFQTGGSTMGVDAATPRSVRTAMKGLVVGLVALGLVGAGCTTSPPDGSPPGTTQEQFCEFWDRVTEAPPSADEAVLVKDGVVALADGTHTSGDGCTDPAARVDLTGAVMAEGREVPSELGEPDSAPVAAVVGEEIAPGEPVLENVAVRNLSAEVGQHGITLRGAVEVTISRTVSTIGFVGTMQDLDNWSITLTSSTFAIPGITTTPAAFTGTLRMAEGVPSLVLAASVAEARIGDITIRNTTLALSASPATGVTASVDGTLRVGPSTATGTVYLEFDRNGGLVIADADISVRLVGSQAGGGKIDLQGELELEGNSQETVASFSGSGVIGGFRVDHASGSIDMALDQATFNGVLDIAQGSTWVRFNATVVWDGQIAYTPLLTAEAGGEYSGTLRNGQNVSVDGVVSTTIVGGQIRTVITGDFELGTLKAAGSAVVDVNGLTTTFEVDADLVGAGFGARLTGVIIMTDGVAERVVLEATTTGTAQLGDVAVRNATMHIESSYGSDLDIGFAGNIVVGDTANLYGELDAVFGPEGTLMSLQGRINNGTFTLDNWNMTSVNGTLQAGTESATVTGSGLVGFAANNVTIGFTGALNSSLGDASWQLQGNGRVRVGSFELANGRVELSSDGGMELIRAGIYLKALGFINVYVEADVALLPTGGCSQIRLTGGGWAAKTAARNRLPDALGCPVVN